MLNQFSFSNNIELYVDLIECRYYIGTKVNNNSFCLYWLY